MSRFRIHLIVFVAGLAALCWVGASYATTNPLALAVSLLIGACYCAGAVELQRYQRATTSLAQAVDGLTVTPPDLRSWLDSLHPSLRGAVRLRTEGERAALPGPLLTPYLVGLLVLLGMLGTLLGMVAALRGTGLALDSATDLQAVRASLAAPVKGLGFAFGTSIAGVATSAMLGLLSALCRRDRALVARRLDTKLATTLRPFSLSFQREQTFSLLQRQAGMMPALIAQLQAMMETMEQRNVALNERHLATQRDFQDKIETSYARLAQSVEQSLKDSVAENARVVGTTLEPVLQSTMAGLAHEATSLRETVASAVQRQIEASSSDLDAVTHQLADTWKRSLDAHQHTSEALSGRLGQSLDQFSQVLEQRTSGLLDGVAARIETMTGTVSQTWNEALSQQASAHQALADRNEQTLTQAVAAFDTRSQALLGSVRETQTAWQADFAARETERLGEWQKALGAITGELKSSWNETGEHTTQRQQAICDALAQTARDMSAQSQAHARETIAEIERLVQTASDAPRAAAEVVAELRQKLSDSMVRDTAMLDERARLLQTVDTLLDAVNHAASEQRQAVDALVSTSTDLLDRVGKQFSDTIETEARKLDGAAAEVTGSAVEMASFGEAFGAAMQMYGESNNTLVAHLERIETALDKSAARSDEQLAYYVAQAREVIDLCMLSQKQIIEDMQALAGAQASAGATPA
ncbi:conserved membrane protein of unknown function [Pararobbsia alpina]|uniref:DUF802 domain-containing protein n=1 Tax=Pararobbsia alpina TaxID=621374 RepID=UPI0039A46CD1